MAVPAFARLRPETRAAMADAGRAQRIGAGEYLFHEGDRATAVHVVDRGMLRVERNLVNGRRVLLTLIGPGGYMGELAAFDDSPRSATCAAVDDTELLTIPVDTFLGLIDHHPDLARDLLTRAAARIRTLSEQLLEAAAGSAATRVAARLVELADMLQPGAKAPIIIRLPITQEELAQWAGLSREGAVGGLRELRDAGVIDTGRMKLTILAPDDLRRWAAEML
ncbi:MAG: Crp/Fnr family transcriptional regulator [Acidimicrobiia bacterium]|nr:Crp/Fnr family transcriptional regulator [Acidimicrobiia bacterium]